jgi:fucose permease
MTSSLQLFHRMILMNYAGAMNGIFFAGATLGCLFIAWTATAFGRLRTIQLASCVCIIGAALMAGSVNIPMYLASRFIMGWGVGMMVCGSTCYPTLRDLHALTATQFLFTKLNSHHPKAADSMSGFTDQGSVVDILFRDSRASAVSTQLNHPSNGASHSRFSLCR